MKFKTLIIASSLTLSMNVYANTFFTPTLWVVAPDKFACNLTNVGDKTRAVKVQIISNGKILLDSGKVELAPRHTTTQTVDGSKDGGPTYCEFAVEGLKGQYRGAAKLFRAPNSSDFVVVPAQ